MYPATESGRSKSGPFVVDDYVSRLLSLKGHQWKIIPHRNASVPKPKRMVVQPYEYDENVYGYDPNCE